MHSVSETSTGHDSPPFLVLIVVFPVLLYLVQENRDAGMFKDAQVSHTIQSEIRLRMDPKEEPGLPGRCETGLLSYSSAQIIQWTVGKPHIRSVRPLTRPVESPWIFLDLGIP